MKGEFTVEVNAETMKAALQKYFIEVVFDASQIARIVSIEPENLYSVGWKYKVSCVAESDKEPQHETLRSLPA